MSWLKEFGYTHCFYVAGGNVMHLLEAASHIFVCVPFVHEVGAAIATDYFNESSTSGDKAFLLVTAGPGLTNAITGITGAWTESREMLVIGGQAKSSEIGRGKYRQIGFQEIDGATLCKSITKASVRIEKPLPKSDLFEYIQKTWSNRKGPVFLEFCLDVSMYEGFKDTGLQVKELSSPSFPIANFDAEIISDEIKKSKRPTILIGGGVKRGTSLEGFIRHGLPIATTFNGADRIGCEYEFYAGHPNWYGSRWANLVIQQSDLIVALGTRLGIMQVGYNWQEFAPNSKVIQIDLDDSELTKGFPELSKA
jgi:acetolactate synthase-1/2/3 large subunit